MIIKIKKLKENAIIPTYSTDGSGAFDISTNMQYNVFLKKDSKHTFTTGIQVEVPEGYVMLLFSRSGHGFKNSVRLSNCVGVIDSDYRGEIKVALHSEGEGYMVQPFERICQGIVIPVPKVEFVEVFALSETDRGDGGFGSTG